MPDRIGKVRGELLSEFCAMLADAFGHNVYHVGSSLHRSEAWNDVDVRVMLDDAEYERMGLGDPKRPEFNARVRLFNLALSVLGERITGLPIDCQLQDTTTANRKHDGQRSAAFLIPRMFAKAETQGGEK